MTIWKQQPVAKSRALGVIRHCRQDDFSATRCKITVLWGYKTAQMRWLFSNSHHISVHMHSDIQTHQAPACCFECTSSDPKHLLSRAWHLFPAIFSTAWYRTGQPRRAGRQQKTSTMPGDLLRLHYARGPAKAPLCQGTLRSGSFLKTVLLHCSDLVSQVLSQWHCSFLSFHIAHALQQSM